MNRISNDVTRIMAVALRCCVVVLIASQLLIGYSQFDDDVDTRFGNAFPFEGNRNPDPQTDSLNLGKSITGAGGADAACTTLLKLLGISCVRV